MDTPFKYKVNFKFIHESQDITFSICGYRVDRGVVYLTVEDNEFWMIPLTSLEYIHFIKNY